MGTGESSACAQLVMSVVKGAPPEAAHREWRVLCLLVHLLGEPPSRLAGPEADALRWLLAGELDITGAGRQG